MTRLRIERRADGWWVLLPPGEDIEACGPFDSERLAREAERGIRFFYQHEWPSVARQPQPIAPAVAIVELGPFDAIKQGMLF